MSAGSAPSASWFHYGVVVESLGGCWQGMTVGPVAGGVEAVDSIPTGRGVEAPLLGVWDHEPSVQEIDAVTPWDFRTICPACQWEGCDDEAHGEANWTDAKGGSQAAGDA